MKRAKRGSLLLICPLLACYLELEEPQPGTSSGEDTMGPTTITAGEDPSATSVDGTGPASETSGSSGDTGSSDDTGASDDTGVVITEIMFGGGEWFEIYNPTDASFQLQGCTVDGGGGDSSDKGFTIDADLEIGPGEYRLFASDWPPYDRGFVADYEWPSSDYGLVSYKDFVTIKCDGVRIDGVGWVDKEDDSFPASYTHSGSLDPDAYDAMANGNEANWCEGTTVYDGYGLLGTPRYGNPQCGVGPVDYPIDACRLQLPEVIVEDQDTDVTAYGRLHIAGLTDRSGAVDPAIRVLGSVGYGPAGTDPAVDATWTWVAALPHANYDPASPDYEPDYDEYWARFEVPGAGTYDYAYRFTGDGGTTFTYCDGQPAGSSDGYQPANAGHMTSIAVIPPVLWFSEYVEGIESPYSNDALEIYNPTARAVDIDGCELNVYFGVDAAHTHIELAGSIAAGDVLVVCNYWIIDTSVCDVLDPMISFWGDEAVELQCGGITLDVIGQIGFDPGDEWLVGGVGTQAETLRRSCSVTTGDANGADVFDPSLEWATFPQDAFDDLGQYVCP